MRDILKAVSKVGFGTLAGLLASVVTGKVLALELGAAGVGLYGILRQLLQTLALLGTFNGQSVLVQGIGRLSEPTEQLRFSGSVLGLQLLMGALVASVLLIGAPWLGALLIPHEQATPLLRWLALAMLVLVLNLFVLGLLNGHRLVNQIVKFQVWGVGVTLLTILPSVWLIRRGYSVGFVLMLVGSAAFVTAAAAIALARRGLMPTLRSLTIRRVDAVQFMRMSSVLTVAGIIATGAQYGQSWMVAKWLGLAHAGQFWAAWTLSMSYLTLVLSALGTYYLPSLSRITDALERRELVRTYLKIVLLFVPVLVSVVVVLKPWVIRIMFSSEMLPALEVMRWMLIGDFFKAVSYVIAYPMLAFNNMKWFFWTDLLFSVGMATASFIWIASGGGIEGLGVIFMFAYVVFLGAAMCYIRIEHGFHFTGAEGWRFGVGLLLVLLVSLLTWNSQIVSMADLAGGVGIVAVYCALALRGTGWRTFFKLGRP